MWACLQSEDPSLHRKAQGTPAQNLDNEVDAVLKHLSKVPVVSFTPVILWMGGRPPQDRIHIVGLLCILSMSPHKSGTRVACLQPYEMK